YVWLASHQLDEVRKSTAAKFRFVPVLFAALLGHHSNLGPAEIPAKRRYTFQDAQRWAVYLGLEFKSPPAHPLIPSNLCELHRPSTRWSSRSFCCEASRRGVERRKRYHFG